MKLFFNVVIQTHQKAKNAVLAAEFFNIFWRRALELPLSLPIL